MVDLTSSIVYPSDNSAGFLAMFNNVIPKTIVPLERIGTEEDMAGCILYLTSRAGSYLNGTVMLTDGGSLSILPSTY
jgi:NAD(P)-dependent dehydrogenase (short-subunit alcohol dehydrogenase family)